MSLMIYSTKEPEENELVFKEALSVYVKDMPRGKSMSLKEITYRNVLEDKTLIYKAVQRGVNNPLFNEIKSNAPFDDTQWAAFLDINIRTLQRYKGEENHIYKPLQSERIFELAEVVSLGRDVFDSPEKFNLWLNTPSLALGSEKPVSFLDNSYGKDLVMAELNRIEHGIFV